MFSTATRLSQKWIDLLHQSFAIVDASVEQAVKATPKPMACAKGCSFCCYQSIPLTILEVLVIKEFLRDEKLQGVQRDFKAVFKTDGVTPCPFLIEGACSIYSVRPIACRRYIVFNKQCSWKELATETRPADVLNPSRKALNYALQLTRPFYEAYGVWPAGENGVTPFFSVFCKEIRSVEWES